MEEKGYSVANLAQGFQLCRAQLFDVLCQRILVVICYNVVGSPAVCCTVDEDSASNISTLIRVSRVAILILGYNSCKRFGARPIIVFRESTRVSGSKVSLSNGH